MKIALFGGTFNPIHIGHLAIADGARAQYGYDKVLFVPVNIPPHKVLSRGAGNKERLDMLRLAIEGNIAFDIETLEIDRGGVSYTYETVKEITSRYKDSLEGKLGYIIGEDWLGKIHTWNHPEVVLGLCDIIVARRPLDEMPDTGDKAALYHCANTGTGGSEIMATCEGMDERYRLLDSEPLRISSSYIREAIKGNMAWRYLVPTKVYQYIEENSLYR